MIRLVELGREFTKRERERERANRTGMCLEQSSKGSGVCTKTKFETMLRETGSFTCKRLGKRGARGASETLCRVS